MPPAEKRGLLVELPGLWFEGDAGFPLGVFVVDEFFLIILQEYVGLLFKLSVGCGVEVVGGEVSKDEAGPLPWEVRILHILFEEVFPKAIDEIHGFVDDFKNFVFLGVKLQGELKIGLFQLLGAVEARAKKDLFLVNAALDDEIKAFNIIIFGKPF